jgi:arylsulfatase A-like enzyme
MTAIMTNVGHHPYKTPETWKKVQFPGVADERLNDYYNCLLYIDGFVQELMQGYERMGLRDNTVFVILGDHGQFFGEHGIRQVFNGLYQEGIHVPAVVYAPALPSIKGVVRGARQHIDVMPTVLELLGYETREGKLPGKSMLAPLDPQLQLYY